MKYDNIEVKGKTFEVEVNSYGKFGTHFDGDYIQAESLAQLKTKLAGCISKERRVAIPVVTWEDGMLRRGMLVGIHATNSNLLIRWEGEKGTSQVSHWRSDLYSPKHAEELARLGQASRTAREALEEFERRNKFYGREAVEKAIALADDEGGRKAKATGDKATGGKDSSDAGRPVQAK